MRITTNPIPSKYIVTVYSMKGDKQRKRQLDCRDMTEVCRYLLTVKFAGGYELVKIEIDKVEQLL